MDYTVYQLLWLFLDRHYPDQRIERVYPNAKIVD